ncbi:MAG: ThiF family adenylyltransferase [Candidatus Carbobacillus altaicus]|nr:ThiF family adenylyltransferase [Candidatus Carbobacillus altaicus]
MDQNIWTRYSRQMLFAPIGRGGQEKLLKSRVAIVGLGALGTVSANHLTRAGVGYLRLIDRDFVEMSNLQRQMLFDEDDARALRPKAVAAREKLAAINSEIELEAVIADLSPENAEALLGDVDLIIDGTDNFYVRFLINDVSVKRGIPWVHGAVIKSRGMHAFFHPPHTPCYRCLFPEPPASQGETCDTVGVIAPIVDIIASLEATAALKYLVQDEAHLPHTLIDIDVWALTWGQIDIRQAKNPACPACGDRHFEFLEGQAGAPFSAPLVSMVCGRNAIQVRPRHAKQVSLEEIASRWQSIGKVRQNEYLLRLEIDEIILTLFQDGRLLVQGVDSAERAMRFYEQYVGL